MDKQFGDLGKEIYAIVDNWGSRLMELSSSIIGERQNSQNRTVRQILGHLVDSAVNNHHRIVRLQYNKELEFPDYRQDNDRWIAIQNYQEEDWEMLVSFWKLYNHHMVHIIKNVNRSCLYHTWHDFEGNRETLQSIIDGYLWHLNLHLNEIEEPIKE